MTDKNNVRLSRCAVSIGDNLIVIEIRLLCADALNLCTPTDSILRDTCRLSGSKVHFRDRHNASSVVTVNTDNSGRGVLIGCAFGIEYALKVP